MRIAAKIARYEIRKQFRSGECSIALPQLGVVGAVEPRKVDLPAKGAQAHRRIVKDNVFEVLGQAYRSAGAAVGFPKGKRRPRVPAPGLVAAEEKQFAADRDDVIGVSKDIGNLYRARHGAVGLPQAARVITVGAPPPHAQEHRASLRPSECRVWKPVAGL